MIAFAAKQPAELVPSLPFLRHLALLPTTGPGRCADPVAAMAFDIEEVMAMEGCANEAALICRGWTSSQIIEYAPDAMARLKGQSAIGSRQSD